MNRIKEIIKLMKEEAEEVPNPDRVVCLHNVMLRVDTEIGQIMEAWRKEEQNLIKRNQEEETVP